MCTQVSFSDFTRRFEAVVLHLDLPKLCFPCLFALISRLLQVLRRVLRIQTKVALECSRGRKFKVKGSRYSVASAQDKVFTRQTDP